MDKFTKITILFVLIFLVGVLGFVTYINRSLDKPQKIDLTNSSEEII